MFLIGHIQRDLFVFFMNDKYVLEIKKFLF